MLLKEVSLRLWLSPSLTAVPAHSRSQGPQGADTRLENNFKLLTKGRVWITYRGKMLSAGQKARIGIFLRVS